MNTLQVASFATATKVKLVGEMEKEKIVPEVVGKLI